MVVFRQPMPAFGLLGSNFVYWNVLGITLWLVLQSIGSDLSYGSALFAVAGTSLLAGFVPIRSGTSTSRTSTSRRRSERVSYSPEKNCG